MQANKLSLPGELSLIKREGKKNRAYRDVKGILTIGVGHTGPEVKDGLLWTDDQVRDAFTKDVSWAVDTINCFVTQPLNQNMFDALVSFVFNVGKYAFTQSTMLKLLNLGFYKDAANEFDKWNKPASIVGRRMSEKDQFLTPV